VVNRAASSYVAALAALGLCGVAGCALRPAPDLFPQRLPASLAADAPLAVVGDLQQTSAFVLKVMHREETAAEQDRLIEDLRARKDELAGLVIVGDLVFTAASKSDWRRFDELVGPLAGEIPILPAIGNHDYYCVFVQKCLHNVVPKSFRLRFPWFAPGTPHMVAYGKIALLFLDTETDLAAQGRWLETELDSLESSYRAALVFFHRPPFTNAVTRGSVPDEAVQAEIVPRLRASALTTVVIAGHVHGYEHFVVDGIHYITSGGGGGPRAMLGAERPNDVYAGPDCVRDEAGEVRRPFNYLLIEPRRDEMEITVRGLCKTDAAVHVIETFTVPFASADAVN